MGTAIKLMALGAALASAMLPALARAEAVVGKITQVTGKAHVKRANNSLDAVPAMPVELHDQLKTETPGELTLQMIDDSVLTLNEASLLSIDESVISGGVRATTTVGLLSGSVSSLVTAAARKAAPSFKVTTPNAIAGVRGTKFVCRYKAGKSRPGYPDCFEFTDCATTTGTVVVSNNPPRPGVSVTIGPGQKTTVACLAAPTAATTGTVGVLGRAAAAGGVVGPAAIVGAGAGAAAVITGTTVGVLEGTGGGGGGPITRSPAR
jgi:ferric-dicitrate binding protein FerR (iron transport regulator)